MMQVPIANNQIVTVMVAQTTFVVLTIPGKRFRIDFLNKVEAHLKPGMRGAFIKAVEHPLLMQYNDPLVTVYINSRPQELQELFEEIKRRIQVQLQSWRDWSSVTLGLKIFRQNLLDGSGMLLQGAPASIAQAVMDACTEYNVSTYTDPTGGAPLTRPKYHLLLIGAGYVIAQDFYFAQL